MQIDIEETIEKNMALVTSIANKLYRDNSVFSKEDLIQTGLINLVKALPKYDETRAKLSTFITHCARNGMIKFIKKNFDKNKINVSNFETFPIKNFPVETSDGRQTAQSNFFDGGVVFGEKLYYVSEDNINSYIQDDDDLVKGVVRMKIKGNTQKKIAEAFNISEVKVKTILKNIAEKIKDNIYE
jgi:RNA polymerase sigma factor (sigma-70 family)